MEAKKAQRLSRNTGPAAQKLRSGSQEFRVLSREGRGLSLGIVCLLRAAARRCWGALSPPRGAPCSPPRRLVPAERLRLPGCSGKGGGPRGGARGRAFRTCASGVGGRGRGRCESGKMAAAAVVEFQRAQSLLSTDREASIDILHSIGKGRCAVPAAPPAQPGLCRSAAAERGRTSRLRCC